MPEIEMHGAELPAPAAPAQPKPETPTEQIVRASRVETAISLPDGRILHVRPMRTLERMDLNAIAGPNNALNLAWMADASIAFSVTKIDGEPVRKPVSMLELRARIQIIGDDGMEAIGAYFAPKAEPDADPDAEDPAKVHAGN